MVHKLFTTRSNSRTSSTRSQNFIKTREIDHESFMTDGSLYLVRVCSHLTASLTLSDSKWSAIYWDDHCGALNENVSFQTINQESWIWKAIVFNGNRTKLDKLRLKARLSLMLQRKGIRTRIARNEAIWTLFGCHLDSIYNSLSIYKPYNSLFTAPFYLRLLDPKDFN